MQQQQQYHKHIVQLIIIMKSLFIIILIMEEFISYQTHQINSKTFMNPVYKLEEFEKYLNVPKFQIKGMQHVYFGANQIGQLYKQKNIDPDQLQCNLNYEIQQEQEIQQKKNKQQDKQQKDKAIHKQSEEEQFPVMLENKISTRQRPKLREGMTHFIHIPLQEFCSDYFENQIKTQIDPNDLDSIVGKQSLHVTLLVVNVKDLNQLEAWEKIVRSLKTKKTKLSIRGVGIFPVKKNTNYTRVLYAKVDGVEEMIHSIASQAIQKDLLTQKELNSVHIIFDKKTDTYRTEQPHLTILKTKGKDIIDATPYLKTLSKLNIGRTNLSQVCMSVIGSFNEEKGFYDEFVVPF